MGMERYRGNKRGIGEEESNITFIATEKYYCNANKCFKESGKLLYCNTLRNHTAAKMGWMENVIRKALKG